MLNNGRLFIYGENQKETGEKVFLDYFTVRTILFENINKIGLNKNKFWIKNGIGSA